MRCLSWKKDARSSTDEDSASISESCGRRILLSIGWRGRMTRSRKEKVGRSTKRTSMCDLPADLVGQEILTRVPITSLAAVKSTCKLWDALTKEWVLGKAAAKREHQFLGFMTQDSKVCSVRFRFCHRNKKADVKDLVDLSIKQVGFLDQVQIYRVLHCDGLLLCVAEDRLMMWNPYLRKTRWITFPSDFHIDEWYVRYYALGYDINRNHKILRFFYSYGRATEVRCEIYEFSSNSWRVLKFTPDWKIKDFNFYHTSLPVKGNNYFYAHESRFLEKDGEPIEVTEYFLVSFDFTTERFGPRLPLPFHTDCGDDVAFSCLKEEKIAVQYQPEPKELKLESCSIVQIWVTNTIEPDSVSWSPFLKVEMKPYASTTLGIRFGDFFNDRNLFIDEEEKVAVVIFLNANLPAKKCVLKKFVPKKTVPIKTVPADAVCQHAALVIGEGGYLKPVSLGEFNKRFWGTPLMWSSSYLPSLVQLGEE